MKLNRITHITGKIELLSGLHIGGGEASMRIGGADSSVVRHPASGAPYIPGSSLKGKIRSLLEWRSGQVREKPLSYEDYINSGQRSDILNIIKLFGISAGEDAARAEELGPTRISMADCLVNREYADKVNHDFFEVKSENSINRITGTAENPRFIERVQSGTIFDMTITLRQFDQDNDDLLTLLFEGMKLLELDNLGGSGSRGYGKVKFRELKQDGENYQEKFDSLDPFGKIAS